MFHLLCSFWSGQLSRDEIASRIVVISTTTDPQFVSNNEIIHTRNIWSMSAVQFSIWNTEDVNLQEENATMTIDVTNCGPSDVADAVVFKELFGEGMVENCEQLSQKIVRSRSANWGSYFSHNQKESSPTTFKLSPSFTNNTLKNDVSDQGAKSIHNRVLSTRQLTRAKCSLATRIWSGTHSFDPTFDADASQTPLSSDHDEEHSIIVWMKCGHQSENQFETELQQEQH